MLRSSFGNLFWRNNFMPSARGLSVHLQIIEKMKFQVNGRNIHNFLVIDNGSAGEFGPTEWLKLSAVSTFFMLKVFQLKKITMGAIGSNTVKEALRLELVFPVCVLQISDTYVILSVKIFKVSFGNILLVLQYCNFH